MTRLLRNPDLLICWKGRQLRVEDLGRKRTVLASPELVTVLGAFERPRSPRDAARALSAYTPRSVLQSIRRLVAEGLLLPEPEARRRVSRLEAWSGNFASALYHAASRDLRYLTSPVAIDHMLRTRVATQPRPPRFKRYGSAPEHRLRAPGLEAAGELGRALDARRTVREFSREGVALEDLELLIRGTWGQTGWLDGGVLGRLAVKTSPSAGALHPIECYVLLWNVRGIAPGLYHYDVRSDGLRRLRRGDFRAAAVKAASGQRWVARAAFVCVMTAVVRRTLWKYQDEAAFKTLWLDAGHLAQTFCLLATSRGLGPFTTAAIQDSFIERLIGLDGVAEFPVYVCGAGVPARKSD